MGKNSPEATASQKQKMIEAIEMNFGNVTKAAAAVGIKPSTYYRWLKEDLDYAEETENMKDIGFRRIKDKLLEKALKMIDTGNSTVLNRMMGIYFKNIPEEMLIAGRYNNVKTRVRIKYIDTREEAMELLKNQGEAYEQE